MFPFAFLATVSSTQASPDILVALLQFLPTLLMLAALFYIFRNSQNSTTSAASDSGEHLERIHAALLQLTQAVQDLKTQAGQNTERLVKSLDELSMETEILEVDASTLKAAAPKSAKPAPPAAKPAPQHHEPVAVLEASPDPDDPFEAETMADDTASSDTQAPSPSDFEQAQELLKTPDENYPDNLHQAAKVFQAALNGPQKNRAQTLLSETYFWLGDIAREKADKERYHSQGVEYGKQSVIGEPNSVAAHMWYAANMGSHGMARGIMSSLFYLGDMEKHGNRALELDKTYFYGAPLRLMGRFYHQCPGWPVGKGDTAKGAKLLEEAVKIGPEFILNHLYLADVLVARRKKREAKAILEDALRKGSFTIMEGYQRNIQKACNTMLQKL